MIIFHVTLKFFFFFFFYFFIFISILYQYHFFWPIIIYKFRNAYLFEEHYSFHYPKKQQLTFLEFVEYLQLLDILTNYIKVQA